MNDLPEVARFALLLVRPAMVMALAPGLGGLYVPAQVKVGVTVLVAIGLLPSVVIPEAAGAISLTGLVAREVAIGLALGFVLRALLTGVEFAGHLSGFQIGFSYAATIDPTSGVRNSMVTALFGMIAVLTLLGVNGHHAVLRALTASYDGLPIGSGGVNESLLTSVREILGLVFIVGARIAAPLVVVLLIVEVAAGLISRTAPALGFMVIGYPVRLVVGLAVLGLVVGAVPGVVASFVDQTLEMAARTATAFR